MNEDPRDVLRDAMILLYEHRHLLRRYHTAVEIMHEKIAADMHEQYDKPLMFNLVDIEKRVDALGIAGITDGYVDGRPVSSVERHRKLASD